METNMDFPPKTESRVVLCSRSTILEYILQTIKDSTQQIYLNTPAHHSAIRNKLWNRPGYPCTNEWIKKMCRTQTTKVLFSLKE